MLHVSGDQPDAGTYIYSLSIGGKITKEGERLWLYGNISIAYIHISHNSIEEISNHMDAIAIISCQLFLVSQGLIADIFQLLYTIWFWFCVSDLVGHSGGVDKRVSGPERENMEGGQTFCHSQQILIAAIWYFCVSIIYCWIVDAW